MTQDALFSQISAGLTSAFTSTDIVILVVVFFVCFLLFMLDLPFDFVIPLIGMLLVIVMVYVISTTLITAVFGGLLFISVVMVAQAVSKVSQGF